MKLRTFSLIIMVLMLTAPAAGRAEEPNIKVLPLPVDRGTAARVVVEGLKPEAGLSGRFDNKPIFFFPAGGKLVGLFGADVMLSPGRYPLELKWKGGRKKIEVTVRDRAYGVRSIKVPESQVKLSREDQARAERERKQVVAALDTKSSERLWSGPWMEPVGGKVNSSFGRQTKINGVLNPRPHLGADFSVPEGTPVKAPADGVVILAGFHFFAGGSVYIDHGLGLISMYFHLSEINVKAGDKITRGEVIALSGKTGRVTGAHLHYGVYLCRARIDPVAFQRLTASVPRD